MKHPALSAALLPLLLATPALAQGDIRPAGNTAPEQAQLVGGVLKGMLAPFDYQAFGGVPMLGIDGTVVIGHGGSSARAIRQMVLSTASLVEQNLTARIGRALRDPGPDASSS